MARRGNGQGSARKRGRTWTAIWTVEIYEQDGKLIQKRKWKGGFRTKTEALQYAAAPALAKQAPAKTPTLREYHNLWLKSDYLDLSKSKQTAFDIAWGKLEELAGEPVDTITIEMLQDVIDAKAHTYYPAKDMRTLLSHLFERAQAEGKVRSNLPKFVRIPPLVEKEMQPFSEEELHKLWEAYGKGDRVLGFVLLMIYTGMMPGELLQLKEMIDWDAREIVGCGLKTKKRKVTPIVFPEMIEPVLKHLVSTSTSKAGYVLGLNKDKFYEQYHESVLRAGCRDLPPYSCRHTTATALALGNNVALSVIQEVMRHAKFSTTQRYIHPDMEAAKAAVNTMGRGKKAETDSVE